MKSLKPVFLNFRQSSFKRTGIETLKTLTIIPPTIESGGLVQTRFSVLGRLLQKQTLRLGCEWFIWEVMPRRTDGSVGEVSQKGT